LKGLFVGKPVVFAATAHLAEDSLLHPLRSDEFNTGSFVWKPIDEIEDVHGQNRLF
jgi:hypothetical protein